jgi:hypothetical protein
MRKGDRVVITGAIEAEGLVLAATDIVAIVAIAKDRSVTLRRFAGSTTPEQWRAGGLPVEVRVPDTDLSFLPEGGAGIDRRNRRVQERLNRLLTAEVKDRRMTDDFDAKLRAGAPLGEGQG